MTPEHDVLTYVEPEPGILNGCLDLSRLYPDLDRRCRFEGQWSVFTKIDGWIPELFSRDDPDRLGFRSESFIPSKSDGRPPVLLVLGNPATHSVASGICFAYEGKGHEHRFWVALGETGLLAFNFDASFASLTQLEKNRIRRQALLDMDYRSPFRIGIMVYFSIPTPASGSTWSGVSGLLRLFGREVLDAIAAAEQRRMDGLIRGFIGNRGAVITFQRDAYEGLRPQDAPAYRLALAKRGELVGTCRSNARIPLYGAPPTRLLHNRQAREALQRVTSCHQDTIKRI